MHDPCFFAIRKADGKRVSIADLSLDDRGLNCGCKCTFCQTDLQARMGTKNRWHFAHTSKGCDAEKVNMTGLYQLVYEYLAGNGSFPLPTVGLCFDLTYDSIHKRDIVPITKSNASTRIQFRSPYPQNSKGKVFIKTPIPWQLKSPEISYASTGLPNAIIDTDSKQELALRIIPPKDVRKNVKAAAQDNYPTIILDLSGIDIMDLSSQYLRENIMSDPKFFYWIYYPKAKDLYPAIYKDSFAACAEKLNKL